MESVSRRGEVLTETLSNAPSRSMVPDLSNGVPGFDDCTRESVEKRGLLFRIVRGTVLQLAAEVGLLLLEQAQLSPQIPDTLGDSLELGEAVVSRHLGRVSSLAEYVKGLQGF